MIGQYNWQFLGWWLRCQWFNRALCRYSQLSHQVLIQGDKSTGCNVHAFTIYKAGARAHFLCWCMCIYICQLDWFSGKWFEAKNSFPSASIYSRGVCCTLNSFSTFLDKLSIDMFADHIFYRYSSYMAQIAKIFVVFLLIFWVTRILKPRKNNSRTFFEISITFRSRIFIF